MNILGIILFILLGCLFIFLFIKDFKKFKARILKKERELYLCYKFKRDSFSKYQYCMHKKIK